MQAPMESYMRVGIVHFMAFPTLAQGEGPWEDTVRHIALDPFFSAVEITHIADDQIRTRVKDLIRLAHLSLGYGAHPAILGGGLNLNSLDEEERRRSLDVLKVHLDEAADMEAETFVVLSGRDPGPEQRLPAVRALVESLRELCAYSAERNGPKVVAEIFDCAVDKCCLLGPSTLGREVAERVTRKYDNFGLLVDLSHIPLLRESPREALVPLQDYLAGVHLGNAVLNPDLPAYGDHHPIFGTPGGVNDVPEVRDFLKVLLDIGFLNGQTRPIVSFEIKPMPGQDALIMIANAKRVLKQAWAMI